MIQGKYSLLFGNMNISITQYPFKIKSQYCYCNNINPVLNFVSQANNFYNNWFPGLSKLSLFRYFTLLIFRYEIQIRYLFYIIQCHIFLLWPLPFMFFFVWKPPVVTSSAWSVINLFHLIHLICIYLFEL